MTRKEAVEHLKEWKEVISNGHRKAVIDMAIEALSKPNYESDTKVRLAVTDRNKDKVVLWDAFGEVEYYPHGEINCVNCPHYYETEDDTGVHGHCGSHGRLIDADALEKELSKRWDISDDQDFCNKEVWEALRNAPTVQADRPHGEWISRIDNGTWMLECSVCGSRVQEEKYRIAVGEDATKCPYCGAELGLGGYLYDEYANRPSQRGEDE